MSLKLLFKIFAGFQLIQGVMMLFGGSMISEMNGWTHSIGITTMAEHHGAGCICIDGCINWINCPVLHGIKKECHYFW